MPQKSVLRKETDETARFRCGAAIGVIREEVWVDEHGAVVRYNLALILLHVQLADHGRVLGYDNAHGYPERHWMGQKQRVAVESYQVVLDTFLREAAELRRQYEVEGVSRRF